MTKLFTENPPKESRYVVKQQNLYRYNDTHILRQKKVELKEGSYEYAEGWKKKTEKTEHPVELLETIFGKEKTGTYVIPSDRLMMFVGNAQRALRKKNVKEDSWGSASVLVYPKKGVIALEWEGILVRMESRTQVEGEVADVISYQFPLFQNLFGNYFKFGKECKIDVVAPTHSKVTYGEGVEGILFHERE